MSRPYYNNCPKSGFEKKRPLKTGDVTGDAGSRAATYYSNRKNCSEIL